jgi:hypothetical protein
MKFINENIPRDIITCCEWRPIDKPWYRENNIVYAKYTSLREVFEAQKDQSPYTLVTEEGDFTTFQYGQDHYVVRFLNGYPLGYFGEIPNNVIKWYGTNLNLSHQKSELLPFGTLKRHNDLINEESLKDPEQKELLYINFSPLSSYRRIDLYKKLKETQLGTVQWPPQDVTPEIYNKHLVNYIYMVSMHKFMFCPEGNGIDTFRIWEAFSLGCIPVLEKSYFSSYFHDLPVLIVNDYSEVTKHLLESSYDSIMEKDWNLDKLKKQYWLDEINKNAN